jgi:hypothetical protein
MFSGLEHVIATSVEIGRILLTCFAVDGAFSLFIHAVAPANTYFIVGAVCPICFSDAVRAGSTERHVRNLKCR